MGFSNEKEIVLRVRSMPITAGLYYFVHEAASAKAPVILIHGAGGSHLSWPPELRRLPHRNTYSIDLPGHGKSEGYGEQTVLAYARQLVEWMREMNLYRVILCGHSMGGAIALKVASLDPEHISGLCLLGVGVRLSIPDNILENLSNPTTIPTALSSILSLSFSSETAPRLVELVSKRFLSVRPSVLKGDFLACKEFDGTKYEQSVQHPMICLAGAQDQLVPLRYVQLLVSKNPGAELSVIPGVGHMLMLENPSQVLIRLITFLEKQEDHP